MSYSPQSKRPLLKRGRTEPANGEQGAMTESATEKHLPPLELPSNATSIRAEITDTFSCENRGYGYYADVDNECQIFHVCLPVMTTEDRKERTFRWSFICPEETVFSQVVFTCVRMEDMPNECKDSEQYYELNNNFGMAMNESAENETDSEMMSSTAEGDNKEDKMEQMMTIEKIEMTTDSKVIMQEKIKPTKESNKENMVMEEKIKPAKENMVMEEKKEKPVMELMMSSNNKVMARPQPDPMTEGLLPPLSNDVYRVGTNGEAEMPEPQPQAIDMVVEETDLSEAQLDEVKELEGESETAQATIDLKKSVIQAVENIIDEHVDAVTNAEEQAVVVEEKKMRRIPDPRGRRFLFRADAKRN